MDGQLLRALYHELLVAGKHQRPRRCTYSDNLIVFLYFFAVLQNASLRWAHDRRHWPLWMRRLPRISYSEFLRRLATASVRQLIEGLNQDLRARLPQTREKCVDGKPLTVGVYTKDREARCGLVAEHFFARGYKLHAIVDSSGAVDAFCVTPLNAGEASVARERLVSAVDWRGVVLRADANYDSNALYCALAERGGRFVAPRRKPGTGLGHGRNSHPDRLRAILDLEHDDAGRRAHRRHRVRVEQAFGHLTNVSFGLFALPNSVRRLHRVERWVLAKITLYHLYLSLRKNHPAVA
jgi:hypothetical protein